MSFLNPISHLKKGEGKRQTCHRFGVSIMKATEGEDTRAKQFRINDGGSRGTHREEQTHSEGGERTQDLIERKLLVAFSCEIEHVPHTDGHHSSAPPQRTLH